jgi:hypothetical protein
MSVDRDEASRVSGRLLAFVDSFRCSFENEQYEALSDICEDYAAEIENCPISLVPDAAYDPEFQASLLFCLSQGLPVGLSLVRRFYSRDPSIDIRFLMDGGLIAALAGSLSDEPELAFSILRDVARRSREYRDLVLSEFPLDRCRRLVPD